MPLFDRMWVRADPIVGLVVLIAACVAILMGMALGLDLLSETPGKSRAHVLC